MGQTSEDSQTSAKGQPKTVHIPKLDLEIGSRLLLRSSLNAPGKDDTPSELVGCVHYEFIVLRLPPSPSVLAKLMPGAAMRARYLHEGVASEFMTSVITYTNKPALLGFFTYPTSLNTLSIRKHKRLPGLLPALMHTSAGLVRGTIKDLSAGGCSMAIDSMGQSAAKALQVGESATLQLPLLPDRGVSSIAVTIRGLEQEQFRMVAGLAFNTENKEFSAILDKYLEMLRAVC
ncbi:flagellar brake protein [Desulfovibrio sp. OttesenSCG-928-C14]|nr:flagellar brake protein [Desulfovibrio sp. OttesenSCG-928-C14]